MSSLQLYDGQVSSDRHPGGIKIIVPDRGCDIPLECLNLVLKFAQGLLITFKIRAVAIPSRNQRADFPTSANCARPI